MAKTRGANWDRPAIILHVHVSDNGRACKRSTAVCFGLSGDRHPGCTLAQDVANNVREVEGEGDADREHKDRRHPAHE